MLNVTAEGPGAGGCRLVVISCEGEHSCGGRTDIPFSEKIIEIR